MGAVRGPSPRERDPKFDASRRLVDGGGCVADRSDLSGVTQKSKDRPGTGIPDVLLVVGIAEAPR